jgi:hypothetical protein
VRVSDLLVLDARPSPARWLRNSFRPAAAHDLQLSLSHALRRAGLRLSALGNRILLRSWRKNLSYCTEEDDEGGLSNYLRRRKGAPVESLVLNRVAENLDDQLCVRNWAGQKPGCSFRCRFSLVTLPRLRG